MTSLITRTVIFYGRVSTDEQREKESILNQVYALERRLETEPDVILLRQYLDDGVSGTIPFGKRPGGRAILAAAASGLFNELWVTRADRLGRNTADLLQLRDLLDSLGITIVGIVEPISENQLFYGFQALMSQTFHRQMLQNSKAGMERKARSGKYAGGISAYGYRVEGKKPDSREVEDAAIVWSDLSAADVVRKLFQHLASDRWSARRIAEEFNALGVPTLYEKDGRGVRGQKTQNVWTAGRIIQIAKNTMYRGEKQWGKRSKKRVISAPCPRLVSDEVWHAAQATLQANQLMPKNTQHISLLRGLIKCGECGRTYCTSENRGVRWYRCNGYLTKRGQHVHGVPQPLKDEFIEVPAWRDIETLLRSPGDLIEELAAEIEAEDSPAVQEAQRVTYETALADVDRRRTWNLDQAERGRITDDELDERLLAIRIERQGIEERLAALEPSESMEPPLSDDLLRQITERMDDGLTDTQRQQIAELLIRRITVDTHYGEEGRMGATVTIEYRLPEGVVTTGAGTRASQNYTTLKRVVVV